MSDNHLMPTHRAAFDLQPTLAGELLELRPLRAEDFADLYAVASDPLIWEQHPAKERCQEAGFRQFFQKALDSGGAFVVVDLSNGRVIGSSRFLGHDPEKRQIEVGYTFLARSHWGGRFNREMKELMLRHAFRYVERVVLTVDPKNIRSQKAVQKIGGVHMGSAVNAEGRDSLLFEITAARFAEIFGG